MAGPREGWASCLSPINLPTRSSTDPPRHWSQVGLSLALDWRLPDAHGRRSGSGLRGHLWKAWPTAHASALGSFFSEDTVDHNVPLEPVRGRAAIETTFARFMRAGGQVDVDIIRVDHLTRADGTTASLPMMVVIGVHDGLIAARRDSFDLGHFTSQVRGKLNVHAPASRTLSTPS